MSRWTPEQQRAYYRENPEKYRGYRRSRYNRNRDEILSQQKERYDRSKGKILSQQKEYYKANRNSILAKAARYRHGPWIEQDWAAMWEAQDGRCYLCGCGLADVRVIVEHDHSCCPGDKSCRLCRRGLACNDCNIAIGLAGDDPDRLRRMADNLEAVLQAAKERVRTRAYQPELLADTGS